MLESSLPAGMRGTFVPDEGAPLRAVVIVSHADGRVVIETQPAAGLPDATRLIAASGTLLRTAHAVSDGELDELWARVQAALQQRPAPPPVYLLENLNDG